MSRLVTLILAAALGAGAFALIQSLGGPEEQPEPSGPGAGDPGAGAPMVQPVESADPGSSGESSEPGPAETIQVEPLTGGSGEAEPRGASSSDDAGNTTPSITINEPEPGVSPGSGSTPFVEIQRPDIPHDAVREEISRLVGAPPEKLEAAARRAEQSLRAGNRQDAYRRYQELFRVTAGRRDITVIPIARRYHELASTPEERLQALDYLVEREVQPVSIYQWALKAGDLALELKGKEPTIAAWKYLTRAYLNAPGEAERKRVTDVLDPFIQKNIFDRGYSHLLTRHTVRPGESLALIARRYQTTIDAIRYLNRLDSSVIQPRQGLLVLAGKVELFVKKSEFRLWATVDDKLLFHARVGLGKNDSTPVGQFTIAERVESPTWYPPGKEPIPPGDSRNILGTRWLGFQDTDEHSGFGIHGTSDPTGGGIGQEVSLGCVRMLNRDIELLFHFVPYKTPITILK